MTPQELRLCAGCHCLAARREARAITRLYDQRLKRHGLKATQFSVLVALALSGETPIGSLAGTLGMERTTLTRSAALLQERGWVSEGVSPDPRHRPLRLTPAGLRKLDAAFPAWKEAQEMVESSRPPRHRNKS